MKSLNIRFVLVIVVVLSILSSVAIEPVLAASGNTGLSTRMLSSTDATRIRFAAGATSAVVSGTLAANSTDRYVLTAGAGQLMNVDLSAPEGASLKVTTFRGTALSPLASSSTSFRGYLPWSGDYMLAVSSGSQSLSYSISVSIPVRVSFSRGATSATITGQLAAHQSLDYILGARANQLMEISATPDSSLQLIIYGVDGSVLRSGNGQGAFFRGTIPLSEDYIVTLRAGDTAVSFTMQVIIPQRISFRPGAISGSVQHYLLANHTQYYVLGASKDQTMEVTLSTAESSQLIIYGADGTVLKSGMGEGHSFSGVLPSTQDYIVSVRAAGDPVWYQLKVVIH